MKSIPIEGEMDGSDGEGDGARDHGLSAHAGVGGMGGEIVYTVYLPMADLTGIHRIEQYRSGLAIVVTMDDEPTDKVTSQGRDIDLAMDLADSLLKLTKYKTY
jgi:hypothetical protein